MKYIVYLSKFSIRCYVACMCNSKCCYSYLQISTVFDSLFTVLMHCRFLAVSKYILKRYL